MKYPNEWQGLVPESLHQVRAGKGQVTVNAYHSLAWIEHFGFPVWKPFEKLQVRDMANIQAQRKRRHRYQPIPCSFGRRM